MSEKLNYFVIDDWFCSGDVVQMAESRWSFLVDYLRLDPKDQLEVKRRRRQVCRIQILMIKSLVV